MTKDRNAVRAGLFIVITVALIIGVVISIKGMGTLLESNQDYVAAFSLADDLGGLKVGDDIRIGGAKVGEVKKITIDAENDRIKVDFVVPKRYGVREDARLGVQQTVTGTSWLNFESLGKGKPLGAGEMLTGRPSSMNQLLASLGKAAPEIQGLLVDVRTQTVPRVNTTVDKIGDTAVAFKETGNKASGLITHVDGKIDPVVERYNRVAENAAGAMGEVRDMIGPSKGDFKGSLANINQATGTIKEKLPGIMEQVKGVMAKVDTSIEKASGALDDVKATVANTKDVSASARAIVVGNRSKLDGMIASLKATGDNLKAASAEIRHSPWRLLYQPKKGEVANLNLYDSARQFAEGANDLSDAAGALRDTLKDPKADPKVVEGLVEKLDKSFANFSDVEKKLWEQVK